jgi:hypothetical protein
LSIWTLAVDISASVLAARTEQSAAAIDLVNKRRTSLPDDSGLQRRCLSCTAWAALTIGDLESASRFIELLCEQCNRSKGNRIQ